MLQSAFCKGYRLQEYKQRICEIHKKVVELLEAENNGSI